MMTKREETTETLMRSETKRDMMCFERLHSTGGLVLRTMNSGSNTCIKTLEDFVQNVEMIVVRSTYFKKPECMADRLRRGTPVYGLPKGHIEHLENEMDATYREIYEEAGVCKEQLVLLGKLGSIRKPDKRNREIHLYLFCMKDAEQWGQSHKCSILEPVLKEEVAEARWVPIDQVLKETIRLKQEFLLFLRDNLQVCYSLFRKHCEEQAATVQKNN
jgi:ADP-ribose pyrophosphatase YjhB (NUDIX family)